jgi:glycosyltransferase involved in cell wall biosynthesis
MRTIKRVCLVPSYSGVGGPASFQLRFAQEAARQGVAVSHDLDDGPYDAILVIGGTRQLGKLWRARHSGIPIVQRLDGFNWLHRRIPTSLTYRLRAEFRNWILWIIRRYLADRIVYQSEFVVRRWQQAFGAVSKPFDVIHNGIDLGEFMPEGPDERPTAHFRLMMLEGAFEGGYDFGLKLGLDLAAVLRELHRLEIEVAVAGKIRPEVQAQWAAYARVPVRWLGVVPRSEIPYLHRSAHLYFSGELHPACPNAVIEALACGLPVAAFDTGALPEIVRGNAGHVVPYGADSWALEQPDIPALAQAAAEILLDQPRFREGARRRAVEAYDIRETTCRYLEALAKV